MAKRPDREASVAVVGAVGTGKTTLIRRLVEKKYGYEEEEYKTTTGFTLYSTVITSSRVYPSVDVFSGVCHVLREEAVTRLSLYDIPCQATRTDLAMTAMNNADVALFVVDRRKRRTMEYVLDMLRLCTARRRILVANFEDGKTDSDPPLTEIEGEEYVLRSCDEIAQAVMDYVLEYAECSSRTGVGVEAACELIYRVAGMVARPINNQLKKRSCNV